MRIGILTFHWATNYGAILQCYALQEYFKEQGHVVEVINYKPRKYDFWFKYLKRPWLVCHIVKDLVAYKKERKLMSFRRKMLAQTRRFYLTKEFYHIDLQYDVIISGSDQVLNPSFTLGGEDSPTSIYYLEPFSSSKRIGYAVSFGCNIYPDSSLKYAKKWISSFDRIGVRENTGVAILNQMEYTGYIDVVPDPTLLLGERLFDNIDVIYPSDEDYICAYILRRQISLNRNDVIYIDDYNNPLSMEEWIGTIKGSKGVITNSYHGMVVAILNHIPFVAIADSKNMNDRFYTLLSKIGLLNHMMPDYSNYESILRSEVDWVAVDAKLNEFRKVGEDLFIIDK